MPGDRQGLLQLHPHSLLSVSGSSPPPSSELQGSGDLPAGL